jgi:multidrug transporter EmrE-like cation transporter
MFRIKEKKQLFTMAFTINTLLWIVVVIVAVVLLAQGIRNIAAPYSVWSLIGGAILLYIGWKLFQSTVG